MMTDFSPALTPEKARMLSPLQLAYIGDSVHALLVRTNLLQKNLLVRDMHRASNEAVSAVSQARELASLLPLLSPEEHVAFYEQSGMRRMDAIKRAAADRGVPKSDLYRLLQKEDRE